MSNQKEKRCEFDEWSLDDQIKREVNLTDVQEKRIQNSFIRSLRGQRYTIKTDNLIR